MGRTKRIHAGAGTEPETAEPSAEPSAEPLADARAAESTQAEAEIADAIALLPRGSLGSLQRFIEGGEREWCEQFDAAEFSLAKIRARWGGGRYIVNWRKPDPKAPARMVGAGSTRFQLAAEKDAAAAAPVSSADARGSIALATLAEEHVKRMLDGQDMLQKMQLAVLKNLTEPRQGSDLTEKLLLAVIAQRQQPAGPGLGEIITLAKELASRNSPTSAMKEALELLEKARDLAGDGGGDGSPAWMGMAAKALDVIGRALSREPVPALPPGETPAPAPAVSAPAPAGSTPEAVALLPTAHAVFHFLAPHMPALLQHAIRDHDPTTYAGVIFDQIEPQYFGEIVEYIERPNFLDLLEANFPQLRGPVVEGSDPPLPVREWFRELRDDLVTRIREALAPPEPEVH